jgi:hypothetical protein
MNVFMKSLELSRLLPMPLRTMEKPAPVVVLKRRSMTSDRLGSGRFMMPFALWKASEHPKPSIVWNFCDRLTVIVLEACRGSTAGEAAAAVYSAPATRRFKRDISWSFLKMRVSEKV